jgi:hypothetical protein
MDVLWLFVLAEIVVDSVVVSPWGGFFFVNVEVVVGRVCRGVGGP